MPKKKTPPPKTRTDHVVISFRVTPDELRGIQECIQRIEQDSGLRVKTGTLAKHATLMLRRHRRMESAIKKMSSLPELDEAARTLVMQILEST